VAWSDLLADMDETCRDEFQTSASYSPKAGGGPISLNVIFDPAREVVSPGELDILASMPVVELISDDLGVTPVVGDTLVVESENYTVLDAVSPRVGIYVLILELS